MSHPSDRFGVAIRQKKIQVDKKKKHAQLSVNIYFLTREFSINRTLLILPIKEYFSSKIRDGGAFWQGKWIGGGHFVPLPR